MPACQGIDSKGCPSKVNNRSVKPHQGWNLCVECISSSDVSKQPQDISATPLDGAPLMVKLPDRHDHIIMDPLLAYCVFAMQSGTMDKVKTAVMGYFHTDAINIAKTTLWSKCNHDIIGAEQKHKNTGNRSKSEADVEDILRALTQLDGNMPTVVISAKDLSFIPRSHPEELHDISLADRLNKIEKRMQKMCESLDGVIAENMALKDQINAVSVRSDPDPISYAQITAHSMSCTSDRVSMPPPRSPLPSTRKSAESQRPVRPRTTSPGNKSVQSLSSQTSGFQKQPHQLRKDRRARKTLIGKSTTSSQFKGAPEPDTLFISRVEPDTTVQTIYDHLTEKSFTVQKLECVSHPNARYKSFKLTVPVKQYKKLYDEDLWPAGVQIRRFNAPIPHKSD